jgi:ribokinase
MSAPAGSVLVVGDANVDLVLRGDVVPRFGQAEQMLDGVDLTLGGSAAIVAAGLAALQTPVRLAARVGDDDLGRITLDALRRRGVDVTAVDVDGDVATGLSVILSTEHDRAILTLLGAIPTLRAAAIDDALLRSVTHVHVASFFLQPDLAAELPALFSRARASGCTISLDTNWDPAGVWAGLADVLPLVDLFLPNAAELVALTGGAPGDDVPHDELVARARSLQQTGPLVAVKAGADGGWAVTGDGVERASGLAVEVVDTTGAGDSFDAGFIAAWARGLPVQQCLRWAVVAGSLSTRAAGGTPGQASLAELEAALS